MTFDPCDSKTWPVRLNTAEVLALARFSRATLLSRIKEGLMPGHVDRGGSGFLYDREAVLLALKIISDPDAPKKDPWDFDDDAFDKAAKTRRR